MTDIVSTIGSLFVKMLAALLPSPASSESASVSESLTSILSMVKALNLLIPFDTIFFIALLLLASSLFYFGAFVVNWILKRIRGG